ncbi:MAG: transglycosylase domain-containing protein, partial [Rhodoferax sp.]|nr:transglycosylase domain-containing protein [Rhodoferax sp.]
MIPALQRAATFTREQSRRLLLVVRRHPVYAALLLPALMLLYVLLLIPFTPGIGDLRKAKSEAPSVLLATDGTVLAEYRRINRQWVTLDKMAPSVVDALIATEDHRFYQHHGIDFQRLAGAVLSTLSGDLQGGSTITQQLARNLYPEEIGRAATITRKLKEAITALKIEAVYSKQEILETYLNTVPFLYNAFGIEMAARTYFDKSADKLDVLESATLIGMLKGTSYYNPVQNPERALQRRNLVLTQMVKHGKLDPARVELLSRRQLRLDFERQGEPLGPAPHVAQHLRKWLIEWADSKDYDIQSDGLRVYTTLDAGLQKAANQAVARQLAQLQKLADGRRKPGQERAMLQAGFLALDPRNGNVRAWV